MQVLGKPLLCSLFLAPAGVKGPFQMHENTLAMWAEGMPGEQSYSWNTGKLLCSVFSWCFPGTAGIGVKCEFWSTVWHGVYMCHQHPARTAGLLALLRRRWKSWAWFSSSAGIIRMWVIHGLRMHAKVCDPFGRGGKLEETSAWNPLLWTGTMPHGLVHVNSQALIPQNVPLCYVLRLYWEQNRNRSWSCGFYCLLIPHKSGYLLLKFIVPSSRESTLCMINGSQGRSTREMAFQRKECCMGACGLPKWQSC